MNTEDALKLIVLGCGDAFGSGGRWYTSYFLQNQGIGILLDCGATSGVALKAEGKSFEEVDYVVLSHFHGDHYGGLPFLIVEAAKVHKRKKPLTLISPPGLEDKLYHLLHLLYPGSEDSLKSFPIEYKAYQSGQPMELSFGKLTAYEVEHVPATKPHGIRLELHGKKIAYSGDTSWHENLLKLAAHTDLFICECNFYERESPSHIHYQLLLKKKDLLNSKRIVLTHLGEEMLQKKEELQIEVLNDGQQLIL